MIIIKSLRHFLGSILWRFKRMRMQRKWNSDSIVCRRNIRSQDSIVLPDESLYMILMPHSDDEWIGCSQIIQNRKRVLVCNMDMAGGDEPALHQKRLSEAQMTASRYNCDLITLKEDKVRSLTELILEKRPNFVLLPFFFDWHQEHVMVMQILQAALDQINFECKVLMYQVSIPIHQNYVNAYIPMTKRAVESKWGHFTDTYKTQAFMPVARFIANEHINGALSQSYACEVYSAMDSDKWRACLAGMLLDADEVSKFKSNLNNIKQIHQILDVISMKKTYSYE